MEVPEIEVSFQKLKSFAAAASTASCEVVAAAGTFDHHQVDAADGDSATGVAAVDCSSDVDASAAVEEVTAFAFASASGPFVGDVAVADQVNQVHLGPASVEASARDHAAA